MTKNQQSRRVASIDRLLKVARELKIHNGVELTTNMALRPDSSFSHIYGPSAEKFISRYGAIMKEDPEFGKTLMLAGFGAPYKSGVQFRGMMSALGRNTPLEVLRTYSYDDMIRAQTILQFRDLSQPSDKPEDGEQDLKDCSLAISHPILRYKASGHYISQFAAFLNQSAIRDVRTQYGNNPVIDNALMAFAKEFTLYEIGMDRKNAVKDKSNLDDKQQASNSDKVSSIDVFAQAAPFIAQSAKRQDYKPIYEVIFQEARSAPSVEYFRDAIKTYVTNTPPEVPPRQWLEKPAA